VEVRRFELLTPCVPSTISTFKLVGAIDSDLESLTLDQVLALVRDWFEQNREFI